MKQISEQEAARIGRDVLGIIGPLSQVVELPTSEELNAKIPATLAAFDFWRAASVINLCNVEADATATPDGLRQQAERILAHIAQDPGRTLVRNDNLTGIRLGSTLILVLNLTCSYQTLRPPQE